MLENGYVDCAGGSGTACEFTVISAAQGGLAIKLRNVAQPHFYLAIINGYFVGHVSNGGRHYAEIPGPIIRSLTFLKFSG